MNENRHPKLISMYGVAIREFKGAENNSKLHICVVMEKMEYDLKHFLNSKKIIEKSDILKILNDVLQAIVFLHSENIVHRDIKPQNILIDKHNGAKLIDLGISKTLKNSQLISNSKSISFTPKYASREAILENLTSYKSGKKESII